MSFFGGASNEAKATTIACLIISLAISGGLLAALCGGAAVLTFAVGAIQEAASDHACFALTFLVWPSVDGGSACPTGHYVKLPAL